MSPYFDMKKICLKKIASWILMICMIVSLMPTTVFASGDAAANSRTISFIDDQGNEYVANRDENVKAFTLHIEGPGIETEDYSEPGITEFYIADVPAGTELGIEDSSETNWYSYVSMGHLSGKITENDIKESIGEEYSYIINNNTYKSDTNLKYMVVADATENATKAILLRIGAVEAAQVDKTSLESQITAAGSKNEASYYTSGDRYNGKTTSKTGFWSDFQSALSTAQTVNTDANATQKQVDAATEALQSAMENLISIENVNPTKLYEAIQETEYSQKNAGDYVDTSWEAFDQAYQDASAELENLYNGGMPTEYNKADLQGSIDEKADTLRAAAEALETLSDSEYYQWHFDLGKKALQPMIQIAESAEASGYTSDSYAALQTAVEAAEQVCADHPKLPSAKAEKKTVVKAYQDAYLNLFKAYYYNLTPTGKITVKLTATDPTSARSGKTTGISGYVGNITLDNDYTLGAALSAAGIQPGASDEPKVYINGIFVSEDYARDYFDDGTKSMLNDIKLHPDDEVVVAWNYVPESLQSPTIAEGVSAYLSQYAESLKTAAFTEGDMITVEAGKKLALHVKENAAYLGSNSQAASPAAGMNLYVSENGSETGNLTGLNPIKEGSAAVTTDETGKAEFALYDPGWYVVSAYDLAEDIKGDWPQWPRDQLPSSGVYASVNSGAVIRVHVTESTDPAQVKKNLQAELEKTYQAYPESYFSEESWQQIEGTYTNAKKEIEEASDTAAARLTQQNAIAQIEMIQAAATADNEAKLKNLRMYLDQLPEDTTLVDSSVQTTFDEFVSAYEALTAYQKNLLSPVEQEKCEALYALKGTALPDAKAYKLTVNVEAGNEEDQAALNAMIAWLQEHNPVKSPKASGADIDSDDYKAAKDRHKLYQYQVDNNLDAESANALKNVVLPVDPGYFAYPLIRESGKLEGSNWSITDGYFEITKMDYLNNTVTRNFTVTINGSEYEIKSISYDGIEASSVKRNIGGLLDKSNYKGKEPAVVNVNFKEALVGFQMPYNDVTITVKWGKVDLDGQKKAAIQAIEKAYAGYVLTEYDDAGKTALENAKTKGIADVNAAVTEDGITAARKAAIAAMAAVAKAGSAGETDMGSAVGKVRVSVENTTYSGAPKDLTGRFLDTTVTLYEKDTMMTCILRALKEKGYSWTGTGGATANGKDDMGITYLASIAKGGQELAQFDGGAQSGWMGTLNDFFTNEGFQSFGVDKSGFYKLENGDEISIMYTSKGLGEDIGGSWDNSDTSLKGLALSGGTLSPAFDGKTLTYTLVIPGDTANVVVTPTAANKNYMVRTYLNSYKKESAFYKRSESIPVKNGDVIYVGVGEAEWPSMNKQGAEARDYSPTKYTIKVVKAGAEAANEAIKGLPAEDKITYGNYKNYASATASAKELYDALSDKSQVSAEDKAKLDAAVKKIQFYKDIDEVKTLLSALPNNDRVSDSQLSSYRTQINAATAAYSKLNDEQKKYITVNDVDNYNKLAERLGMTSIAGSDAMPESPVVTEKDKNGTTTTAPAEVKVSGTTATAAVKDEIAAEILKQARENKSTEIVLQVAASDTAGAAAIQLQMDKALAQKIVTETSAALTVETENGAVTLDRATLKQAVSEAKGSDLTLIVSRTDKANDAQKEAAGKEAQFLELQLKSGGQIISNFAGMVTVKVKVPDRLKDKKIAAVHVAEDGKMEQLPGKALTEGAQKYYQFMTTHFSLFALVDAEAAGLETAEPDDEKLARIKKGVQNTTIKITKTSKGKGWIQIKWKKSKGYKVDYYEVFRKTGKNTKFGKKAFYKTKKHGMTGSYKNTKALKKGKRYYYKVRGVRVIDGKKYYTKWSRAYYRIAK